MYKKERASKPTHANASRCLEVRCRAKRGLQISQEDKNFCEKMCTKYPEWYKQTEIDVFNATVPFGSSARRKAGD